MLEPIYLNVLLLNKDEVVSKKVTEKTGLTTGIASYAANKAVSDETVTSGLSSNLKEKIEISVGEMGITAEVQKKFQKGVFVVMRILVLDIDILSLVLKSKGPEFASAFSTIHSGLGGMGLAEKLPEIEDKIRLKVYDALLCKLGEMIPMKMNEAGLEVECNVCSEQAEARIFFDMLDKLD